MIHQKAARNATPPVPPNRKTTVNTTLASEVSGETINHEINNIRTMKSCSKDDNNGLKWKFAALDYVVSRCGYLQIRREILTVVK